MPPGKSSDSLRAVLLSAKSGSGSGSKPSSSSHTWHSLRSAAPTGDPLDLPGQFFPSKLAMTAGLIKLIFGLFMIGLGGLAMLMKASMSTLGAGLWVGVIVGVSGFLGICASRRPYAHIYVISFLSLSILSMAASGLLVVLSATAWARDSQTSKIVVYDAETESEIDIFGQSLTVPPSVHVSRFLVVLGVVDILISLACVALSAREACRIDLTYFRGPHIYQNGHVRKERLYRWLGQQKHLHVNSGGSHHGISSISHFVPLSTSEKKHFRYITSNLKTERSKSQKTEDTFISSPSASFSENKRPYHKNPSEPKNSSVVLIHPQLPIETELQSQPLIPKAQMRQHKLLFDQEHGPQSLPSMIPQTMYYPKQKRLRQKQPHHEQRQEEHLFHSLPYPQTPVCAVHPNGPPPHSFYPLVMPFHSHYDIREPILAPIREKKKRSKHSSSHLPSRQREKKREKKSKTKRKEEKTKRKKPLTDEQIEKTYTGLDREIAEGFISLTMEPAISIRKAMESESESF